MGDGDFLGVGAGELLILLIPTVLLVGVVTALAVLLLRGRRSDPGTAATASTGSISETAVPRPGAAPLAPAGTPRQSGPMIVAFSVQPTGEPSDPTLVRELQEGSDSASVHDAVAAAVKIVRQSGLPHSTSSMFTEIEGEWGEVMEVVRRATEAAGRYGSRVSLVLKADIRPGHHGELTGKIDRLEKALHPEG